MPRRARHYLPGLAYHHHSSLVQCERYLFTCYRHIESNPVHAGMVRHPSEYRWSSYTLNSQGDPGWLTPREEYLQFGAEPGERAGAYRGLFTRRIQQNDLDFIRKAIHSSQPIGDAQFREYIETYYSVSLG